MAVRIPGRSPSVQEQQQLLGEDLDVGMFAQGGHDDVLVGAEEGQVCTRALALSLEGPPPPRSEAATPGRPRPHLAGAG